MGRSKYLLIAIFLMFYESSLKAQTYTGCLVGNTIYTQDNPFTSGNSDYYYDGTNYPLGTRCSAPNPTPCTVTQYFFIFPTKFQGIKSSFSVTYCPVDDYVVIALVLFAGIGFFSIKNRRFVKN